MLREKFASDLPGNGERVAARIFTRFLLRHALGLAALADGDLLRGVILARILDANVGHLGHWAPGSDEVSSPESTVPDNMRRPISISAIARDLGFPYETTRRHVARLMDTGACVRVGNKGVIVPADWISSRVDVTGAIYASLRRMLHELYEAGFDLERMGSEPYERKKA